jgi:predicted transcriptional regulator
MVQTYTFMTKKVKVAVVLGSAVIIAHTSGRQVVKVNNKPINILEGLENSQLRKLKYSALTLSETFTH